MSRASGRWTSWVGEIEVFGKRPHARLYTYVMHFRLLPGSRRVDMRQKDIVGSEATIEFGLHASQPHSSSLLPRTSSTTLYLIDRFPLPS